MLDVMAIRSGGQVSITEHLARYLTRLKYDLNLVKQGFYPAVVSDKKIEILDVQSERKLKFKLKGDKEYEAYDLFEYKGYVPQAIRDNIKEDNVAFEGFEILKPERNVDPFLFGIKGGNYYYIASWDTEEWKEE